MALQKIYNIIKTIQKYEKLFCFNMQKGFSLAEILVALIIIGIIATLTIPAVVQKYQEIVTVNKVKKAYSLLENALKLAIIENGYPDQWNIIGYEYDEEGNHIISSEGSARLAKLFAKYIKSAKICEGDLDCFGGTQIKSLGGKVFTANGLTSSTIILNDGTRIAFTPWNNDCDEPLTGEQATKLPKACGSISIKTNNAQTHCGINEFTFYLLKDRILPWGASVLKGDRVSFENYCIYDKDGSISNKENGLGCTGWVIEIGNMDYRKCGDLSYEGKRKCD